MKRLTKLTSLMTLAVGLATAPLASAESEYVGGPYPEHQSLHMRRPVPRPLEAHKHKAEPPMKKPFEHAVKKMLKRHHHYYGR